MILPSARQSVYDGGVGRVLFRHSGKTTNQTMDSQENNYTAPRQENGVINESGNVDRIRTLLSVSQMRDYAGRFQNLEERLAREASELRGELQRQLQALEAFMK